MKREREVLEKQRGKASKGKLTPRKSRTAQKAISEPETSSPPILSAPSDPMLSTDPELWYPKFRRTLTEQKQPPRPGMMALTLVPRADPQIMPEDKDVWDYVLRRMFVSPGSPLEVAIKYVARRVIPASSPLTPHSPQQPWHGSDQSRAKADRSLAATEQANRAHKVDPRVYRAGLVLDRRGVQGMAVRTRCE